MKLLFEMERCNAHGNSVPLENHVHCSEGPAKTHHVLVRVCKRRGVGGGCTARGAVKKEIKTMVRAEGSGTLAVTWNGLMVSWVDVRIY